MKYKIEAECHSFLNVQSMLILLSEQGFEDISVTELPTKASK